MSLILASSSPRRKEILEFFKLSFKQAKPQFDEAKLVFQHTAEDYVCELAHHKALSQKDIYPNDTILAADTLVFLDGKMLSKPVDATHAMQMLASLSGKWHSVFTGVAVLSEGKMYSQAEETEVCFNTLTRQQMDLYHQAFFYMDKAGGYAIQQAGSIIVKSIKGCFYNIMGLPINTTRQLLSKVGIDLWHHLK